MPALSHGWWKGWGDASLSPMNRPDGTPGGRSTAAPAEMALVITCLNARYSFGECSWTTSVQLGVFSLPLLQADQALA
jgi:hypothetical protein